MPMRRLAFTAALLAATMLTVPMAEAAIAPKMATAQTAEDVAAGIKDLYTRYFAALMASNANPDAKLGPDADWDTIADAYFDPQLAARFRKATAANEPVIDWDFFVDGQD